MTEKQDREIELRDLANKFAVGNKAEARGWLEILRQAVEDGRLEARESQCNPTRRGISLAGWKRHEMGGGARREELAGRTWDYHFVTPAAVAAWLTKLPEQATKDIHSQGWAWLGDAWPVAAVLADIVKPGKPEARKESIRALLAAIQEAEPDFSPEAMPGKKSDFFELCRAWNPDFRYVVQDTFNDYLPGLCKFKPGARATDFYREIGPRIGVKLDKAI